MKLADKIKVIPMPRYEAYEPEDLDFLRAKAAALAASHDALMQQMAEALEKAEPQTHAEAMALVRAALRAYKELIK